MARDLLFREEAKSRRIKKIKSHSYRRVHRKAREKEERMNKEALLEAGIVPSDEEQEAQDRRRAEERMGGRHRKGKWAKGVRDSGRAVWDDDARAGITEMARRDEELRKRVEGKVVRKEHEDNSEVSSDEDDGSEDDESDNRHLLQKLDKLGDADENVEAGPGSKLRDMKFMRNAEAARRRENDAMMQEMRRELAGEETPIEEEKDTDVGRRIFGPGVHKVQDAQKTKDHRGEFEEPSGSDEEGDGDLQTHGLDNGRKGVASELRSSRPPNSKVSTLPQSKAQVESSSGPGAWSKPVEKATSMSDAQANRRRHQKNRAIEIEELDLSKAAAIATQSKLKARTKSNTTTMVVSSDSEESNDESSARLPFAIRDQELIKRAFAGADVVGEFEGEKNQTIEDEDEKVVDNTMPGWGSWVGDGLSKKDKARNKGRVLKKIEGIKEQNRKDAKLDRVIINEKHVKKVNFHVYTSGVRCAD